MLEIRDLSKTYHGNKEKAVHDLSFQVNKGEIFALVGESGCGKSTTLKCIAGLEQPTDGEVYLDSERIIGPWEKLVAGHDDIKLVSQSYDLFPNLSVWENIKHPIRKYTKKYQEYRINTLIELCNLKGYEEKKPESLSGGEQQRVAIACAIADEPKLLVMDEPFSNLDIPIKSRLRREVKAIVKQTGTTVIFVSHDTSDALAIADRVGIMKDGYLMQVGTPKEIYETPSNNYIASFFPYTNILEVADLEKIQGWQGVQQATSVCIRPEHIRINKNTVNSAMGIKSKVSEVEYAGSIDFIEVETFSGLKLNAQVPSFQFAKGEDVICELDMEKVHFMN